MPIGMVSAYPLEGGADDPASEKLKQLLYEMSRQQEPSLRDVQREAGVGPLYAPNRGYVKTPDEVQAALLERARNVGGGPQESAERIAGATALRDAEARMPGPAWGAEIRDPEFPIDRNMILNAVEKARMAEDPSLMRGYGRHLSSVGREQPEPSTTLEDRMKFLKGELPTPMVPHDMNIADAGRYRPGKQLINRDGTESSTRVEESPNGGIRLKGEDPSERTYEWRDKATGEMKRGGYDQYSQASKAGIKAERAERAAKRQAITDRNIAALDARNNPIEGLGGLTEQQAAELAQQPGGGQLLMAIAMAQRGQGGSKMEPWQLSALELQKKQQEQASLAAYIDTLPEGPEKEYYKKQLLMSGIGGIPQYVPKKPQEQPLEPPPSFQYNKPLPSTMPPSLRPPGH